MSQTKRKSDGRDKPRRRYRPDGTLVNPQRTIDGPGVWVTCVRGKEKQAVGELYDLFEQLASELWPVDSEKGQQDVDGKQSEEEEEEDIEKMIAKEMSSMKRPRKEQRFANCQTNTPCLVFISCKPPVDPVQLVIRHIENILNTGVTYTKYAQRLTPITAACTTNVQEITALCTRLLSPFLSEEKPFSYKIELRMRNHSTLSRLPLIEEVAKCVPPEHKVDLVNPSVFILIEIFKSVCGISVVRDYYRLQKFNVMELAKTDEPGFKNSEGRVTEKDQDGNKAEAVVKEKS